MALREILKEELEVYILYTVSYINTVKDFVSRSSEWIRLREAESKKLRREKKKSKEGEAESGYKDEAELEKGLKETLWGLKEMQMFLDAVERLGVTSRLVFEQNQVLQLPDGADLETVQNIVFVAQLFCPLLLSFKRDNEEFFKPKMENLEVMQFQLSQYIRDIKLICDMFRKSFPDDLHLNVTFSLNEDVSDDDIEKMLSNINKLNQCRMDEDVRLLVLFQDKHELFLKEFTERKDKMLQYLSNVEACAVQLDDMNKGAKISSVVGSSVGVVSGILSIIGFALIPVTAGASVALIGVGAGLGIASGANRIVTTATEAGVNKTQKEKAKEAFQQFTDDVNVVQISLNDVIKQHFFKLQEKITLKDVLPSGTAVSVLRGIDTIVDCFSALRASTVASEAPELGQAVLRGSLAMSSAARGGMIALNALFIGMDVAFIVKDSISLSKGSETEISKFFRARADLWKSEIDSWQKMIDSVEKGIKDSNNMKSILKEPFY